jgi:2,4-dienoyl-CoA reductase-like NADH-dependent reductase (Old Yellow Enzyme family)
MAYQRIGALSSVAEFRAHVDSLDLDLPIDDTPLSAADGSPLAEPMTIGAVTVGNRWCVHPMEGWDGTRDGQPSDHTLRRWQHFGESGCKLIWGGEAYAVRHDGRANPQQLCYRPGQVSSLRQLLQTLEDAHQARFGPAATEDLLVGLQLTHSGRFSRPHTKDRLEPRIAYHHPLLDSRCGIDPSDEGVVLTDGEIRELIDDYVLAARAAWEVGFRFVDVKACHGYLGHEFLSAFDRPGPYGGDFEGRTRFLREIIVAIRSACPGLMIGVRLSVFDRPPYIPDPRLTGGGKLGPGIPVEFRGANYPGFGCARHNPLIIDLTEPIRLIRWLVDEYGVAMINASCGSPYYNPHILRPAYYPPSDGYQPPEDPLVGCARQMHVVRELKQALPDVPIVGTGYTYFQEYLPLVAQAAVRAGWVDFVGIGRLVLSDWDLPHRVLAGEDYRSRKKICRTFSDCTTAPRNGIISGCFPLDEYYKHSPEAELLKEVKSAQRKRLSSD